MQTIDSEEQSKQNIQQIKHYDGTVVANGEYQKIVFFGL